MSFHLLLASFLVFSSAHSVDILFFYYFLLLTCLVFSDLELDLLEAIVRAVNTIEYLREPRIQKTLKELGSRERGGVEKISAFNTGSALEKDTVSKVM